MNDAFSRTTYKLIRTGIGYKQIYNVFSFINWKYKNKYRIKWQYSNVTRALVLKGKRNIESIENWNWNHVFEELLKT